MILLEIGFKAFKFRPDFDRAVILCSYARYATPAPNMSKPPAVTVLAFSILMTGNVVKVLRIRQPTAQEAVNPL